MSDETDQQALASSEKKSSPTRYRILWGKLPDPEAEEGSKRPTYREILNPRQQDGAYVATSAETARRAAYNDEETEQHPFIVQALKQHGVVIKHVALSSWGDDEEALADPLKITKVEQRTGKV